MVPQKNPGIWGSAPSIVRGTIIKITTPMALKHDHSVEIHQKSPDMNLEIYYDNNLGFNNQVRGRSSYTCRGATTPLAKPA